MKNPNCPNLRCDGTLEFIKELSTCVGFFDFDTNRKTETFKCDTYDAQFVRYWKWEKIND